MELLQLQYFRAIATYGSMSQAAQMLFVSQPTLSVTMTRLEESLGFPLFVRQKGKLSLTKEGLQFLDCVDRILSESDDTVSSIRNAAATPLLSARDVGWCFLCLLFVTARIILCSSLPPVSFYWTFAFPSDKFKMESIFRKRL